MHTRNLTFTNSEGVLLAARLDLPAESGRSVPLDVSPKPTQTGRAEPRPASDGPVAYQEPRAIAMFAHCFTCTKDSKAAFNIAKILTGQGLGVLRLDFAGIGESGGAFEQSSFSTNVADLIAASDFLAQSLQAPRLLIGHSLGGAAVLQAAALLDAVAAVAVIGAPYQPGHVSRLFESSRDIILEQGRATVDIAGRPFTITRRFLEDLAAKDPQDVIGRLNRALLVLHAPLDGVVGIDQAAAIFKAAKHPKSFISLNKADHLLANPRHATYAANLIAAWAEPYINQDV